MCGNSCGIYPRSIAQDVRASLAAELEKAAAGADVIHLAIALRLALMLENVECRIQ